MLQSEKNKKTEWSYPSMLWAVVFNRKNCCKRLILVSGSECIDQHDQHLLYIFHDSLVHKKEHIQRFHFMNHESKELWSHVSKGGQLDGKDDQCDYSIKDQRSLDDSWLYAKFTSWEHEYFTTLSQWSFLPVSFWTSLYKSGESYCQLSNSDATWNSLDLWIPALLIQAAVCCGKFFKRNCKLKIRIYA